MDIAEAKQQVKDTVEAYLATDSFGDPLLPTSKQRPIFLVGAPGIGKTAIMSQIADELDLGLVSYSMTHHTRQSALGLPFIIREDYKGYEYDASEYTMSEIIASVYDCMRESGRENGILFLDEINCVSETLYPSMLQFLQFKTFGRHKVPDGWVIVTAGNPPEYNRSVHEFDIVTLDRVKKIVVEPDFEAWKAYAVEKHVHPAILTFLSAKKDDFYSIKTTIDGKEFVTARAWDDLSDIIRIYESIGKEVNESLISHYVQSPKIAAEFAAYYDLFNKYKDDYKVEQILEGDAEESVITRAQEASFDERLSLIGLLLDSLDGEFDAIMMRTDLLIAIRDDLRSIKAQIGGSKNVATLLEDVISEKETALEMLQASGNVSKRKKQIYQEELIQLRSLRLGLNNINGDEAQMSELEKMFEAENDVTEMAQNIETQLANAFSFLEDAFGDAQEVLIFETELTQRTPSARFIAQYGSDSYFAHNQKMIMSDSQRKLRGMVDDLDELWDV